MLTSFENIYRSEVEIIAIEYLHYSKVYRDSESLDWNWQLFGALDVKALLHIVHSSMTFVAILTFILNVSNLQN
jgi:hypothetical protein